MQITILALGSRGDVQPFAALGGGCSGADRIPLSRAPSGAPAAAAAVLSQQHS